MKSLRARDHRFTCTSSLLDSLDKQWRTLTSLPNRLTWITSNSSELFQPIAPHSLLCFRGSNSQIAMLYFFYCWIIARISMHLLLAAYICILFCCAKYIDKAKEQTYQLKQKSHHESTNYSWGFVGWCDRGHSGSVNQACSCHIHHTHANFTFLLLAPHWCGSVNPETNGPRHGRH